jgi:malate dehydrogenase (oxaloacetate-decarboxylating)
MMDDLDAESVALHERLRGKITVESKFAVENRHDLSLAYTPGVAAVCMTIARDPKRVYDLTCKRNMVAVVTDGSAVLGLGNIGPEAALPVMEGKAILFKTFAGVDAFPICVATQDADEIVRVVRQIAPVFGGVNLEDISSPRCFDVEARLQDLGIPVFHDDQHGTAIVVMAALLNALEVTGKRLDELTIVFNGSGAAALACTRLLVDCGAKKLCLPVKDVILCDSKGIIHRGRTDLNSHKAELAKITNVRRLTGGLREAIAGADVFIGLSQAKLVDQAMIKSMAPNPIVFAMANPVPEIMPDEARAAGAVVVGSGRSDFPNQINNVLAFPGVFRGALDAGAVIINDAMKIRAAFALADCVIEPTPERVLPDPLDKTVAYRVAEAVARAAVETEVCREPRRT